MQTDAFLQTTFKSINVYGKVLIAIFTIIYHFYVKYFAKHTNYVFLIFQLIVIIVLLCH